MTKSSYASRVPQSVLKAHLVLGALQISVGCLVIVLGIVCVAQTPSGALVAGGGLWAGPFFIAAGVAGVVASRRVRGCTQGCVVTCLVVSILAACLGFNALFFESFFTAYNSAAFRYRSRQASQRDPAPWSSAPNPNDCGSFLPGQVIRSGLVNQMVTTTYPAPLQDEPSQAANIVCAALIALGFVLAIVHSAFACRASCCCVRKPAIVPDQVPQQQVPQQVPQDPHVFLIVDAYGRVVDPATIQPMPEMESPQPPYNPDFMYANPPPYEAGQMQSKA